jgi:PKD repeat protein
MKGISIIKAVTFRFLAGWVAFSVVCGFAVVTSAQTARTVRVVAYNIQADTTFTVPTCGLIVPFTGTGGSFTTSCSGNVTNGGVLEGIGEEIIAGDPAQPIDVLALEETTSNTTTVQPIVNGLNAFYAHYGNPAGYAMSTYQATESGDSPTDGNGPNALVYNTNTLQLLASVPIDPPGGTSQLGSASGMYREVMRYEFAPTGVTAGTNNEFYVYVSHYKADSGATEDKDRLGEATIIRNNEATSLPANARVLYVGDYNPDDNSGEPGYQTICSNSAPDGVKQGQGVDPLNILWGPYTDAANNINWSVSTTNKSILFMMSEESYELRYRDDLQIMTSNVYYDVAGGLQYVPGSFHSFGNNASLPYQDSVNTSGNTALADLDPSLTNLYKLSAAVLLEDLTGASDHLPIVADYTIPIGTTAPPSASFTGNPTSGVAPLTVTFTDTSTGSITNWSWSFGDSGTTNLATNSVLYTYNTAGVYTVTEIVSGSGGSSTNTKAGYITVLTPPPVASFTGSPTSGVAPLAVTFTDTSSGTITNWSWSFGDGGTTNLATNSVLYTYNTAGVYSVTEIVSGPGGSGTNTQVNYITVLTPFQAWQIQYFGSTTNPAAAASADPLGKGMSNFDQFLAGINPTNPASALRITSVTTEGSDVLVTWTTAGGYTNVVQATAGLADGSYSTNFVDLSGLIIISGSGDATTNYLDSGGATNIPARYYRVRLQP